MGEERREKRRRKGRDAPTVLSQVKLKGEG